MLKRALVSLHTALANVRRLAKPTNFTPEQSELFNAIADLLIADEHFSMAFPALTWDERIERMGMALMPTTWPQMTDKERQSFREKMDKWARAACPEFVEPQP